MPIIPEILCSFDRISAVKIGTKYKIYHDGKTAGVFESHAEMLAFMRGAAWFSEQTELIYAKRGKENE